MDLNVIVAQIGAARPKIAARVYQRQGNHKFDDRLTLGRNGKAQLCRRNYGEAAGVVYTLNGRVAPGGAFAWNTAACAYTGDIEAPVALTGTDAHGALEFDGGRFAWAPLRDEKAAKELRLTRVKVLLGK